MIHAVPPCAGQFYLSPFSILQRMWLPLVSIILPAYNCEKYISQSVESILHQVYDRFELIIINDGSSDNTAGILQSFTDPRVQVYHNDGNKGLVYTLNRGIAMAKGEFIARMDADDIATNDRIEKQVHWLLHHPDTAAVASFIRIIDSNGNELPDWPLDRATTTAASIKAAMPRENCLAHPTMMMRTEILRQYLYEPAQQHIEDYDLWLRMIGDGLTIDKIPQHLLYYREHQASVTSKHLRNRNPFLKNYYCKKKFLARRRQEGKWGAFEKAVNRMMWRDRFMALAKNIKQRLT